MCKYFIHFTAKKQAIVCLYHNPFIHLFIDGHIGCFYLLTSAIMKFDIRPINFLKFYFSVTVSIQYNQCSFLVVICCEHGISKSWPIAPRERLLTAL